MKASNVVVGNRYVVKANGAALSQLSKGDIVTVQSIRTPEYHIHVISLKEGISQFFYPHQLKRIKEPKV